MEREVEAERNVSYFCVLFAKTASSVASTSTKQKAEMKLSVIFNLAYEGRALR